MALQRAIVKFSVDALSRYNGKKGRQSIGERIRDVRAGPDGALWLATDNTAGRILRVVPAK